MAERYPFEFDMEEAVRRYSDMVYRLALLNMKSRFDAEDVFQEVFLKLFRYKNSIQSEEHLKAWLIRVTINQCKSMTASGRKRQAASLDTMGDIAEPVKKEEYTEVYELVQSLPLKYRQVIHLYYYEELSVKEIAEILNQKEGTVKTRLARARKLLNQKLEGGFSDGRI
ncbi:MAG: sigma-70 family RNA polymerase sigma factor [Bacteroides sp.]|nr:sigma-70 family RNA polymerase sigma factor [Bacteroides sp.]MCM1550835.1 sigma-70 family RNA polymerase sigma factor [Clostridium sp.]